MKQKSDYKGLTHTTSKGAEPLTVKSLKRDMEAVQSKEQQPDFVLQPPMKQKTKKCSCVYTNDGKQFGLCLRCFDMQLKEYQKGYRKGQADAKKGYDKDNQ